jgi:hypothetical protein
MKQLIPSLALLFLAGTTNLGAQVLYIPAKQAVETRFPVFQNGSNQTEPLANFRLVMEYGSTQAGRLVIGEDRKLNLPSGRHGLELVYEQLPRKAGIVRAKLDGEVVMEEELAAPLAQGTKGIHFESEDKTLSLGGDFTAYVQFTASKDAYGTLFSKCRAGKGAWSQDAKALFMRNGRLVYDIGWVGALKTKPDIRDGNSHEAVVVCKDGDTEVFLDKEKLAGRKGFTAKDREDFVFKLGSAGKDFGGSLKGCAVASVRYWPVALVGKDLDKIWGGGGTKAALDWQPDGTGSGKKPASATPVETFQGLGIQGIPSRLTLEAGDGFEIRDAWVQPLESASHAKLVASWGKEELEKGKQIYTHLCITCHGTPEQEGTLPTALKYHQGVFKNGSDPYRMYQTLQKGYGLMIPLPQYTDEEKYAVIHYIRETFVKPHNPGQYFNVSSGYLAGLPLGLETVETPKPKEPVKPYEKMDFGPTLMWTYQVGGDNESPNIAQKGINLRLDSGQGGVSKGNAWMLYEHDTMRVAAAYSGNFVDWKGIAFDGSHGTHTSITGDKLFFTEDAPAWENPVTGGWEDVRVVGRDGRKYGPLPAEWIRYLGTYYHGNDVPVIHYSVGEADILEQPGYIHYGAASVFTRTLNVGKSPHALVTKLAPDVNGLHVVLKAPEGVKLARNGTNIILEIPACSTPAKILVSFSMAGKEVVGGLLANPADLAHLAKGGPPRFGKKSIQLEGVQGDSSGAFAIDTIPVPNKSENPWESWMRLGGFDFFPDNPDRAAVCTWNGDVWLVDGVAGNLKKVTWRRICSGLFQPLGLKIVDGHIYITCRDQIAKLHDFNGDMETDYVECFNNHAQVTEHFHEFAMGLQTDDKGNFYYAKSARHAKVAVVPHHGTLIRVSPDGKESEILARGFRAANGVCLNPDGTWIVTDQEGHWNPKNRINYVRKGGFYGNMYGYHDVTDEADSAMEQPLCWITNAFDRSPAELMWVPKDAKWGTLNGVLLNLSYGYGQLYTVPHEILPSGQAQGGMSPLPIGKLPTGTHRGRFHPQNGQLYVAGMFAWAGSQQEDGGFFRIRKTGNPTYLPIKTEARKGQYVITFSDPLPQGGDFQVKAWDLKRTKNYGSKHYNERQLEVKNVAIRDNTAILDIPALQPTWGMEVKMKLGSGEERILHNSIHELP